MDSNFRFRTRGAMVWPSFLASWAFFSARNCSALRARSGLTPLPAAPGPGRTECWRRLLLQCGFSRSAVKGISSMTLTSSTPPRAPARTTRKWHDAGGGRRGRWLALVRFAAMPVAISARWPRRAKSPRPHRCSYRCLEANPRNYRLPQNCNRHTGGGENGAVAFA